MFGLSYDYPNRLVTLSMLPMHLGPRDVQTSAVAFLCVCMLGMAVKGLMMQDVIMHNRCVVAQGVHVGEILLQLVNNMCYMLEFIHLTDSVLGFWCHVKE